MLAGITSGLYHMVSVGTFPLELYLFILLPAFHVNVFMIASSRYQDTPGSTEGHLGDVAIFGFPEVLWFFLSVFSPELNDKSFTGKPTKVLYDLAKVCC